MLSMTLFRWSFVMIIYFLKSWQSFENMVTLNFYKEYARSTVVPELSLFFSFLCVCVYACVYLWLHASDTASPNSSHRKPQFQIKGWEKNIWISSEVRAWNKPSLQYEVSLQRVCSYWELSKHLLSDEITFLYI